MQPSILTSQTWYQIIVKNFDKRSDSTFNSPSLTNHSPYELVFRRKPKLLLDLEMDPDIKVPGTYREYFIQLGKRLEYLHKLLQDFRMKRLALINKDRDDFCIIAEN